MDAPSLETLTLARVRKISFHIKVEVLGKKRAGTAEEREAALDQWSHRTRDSKGRYRRISQSLTAPSRLHQ